MVKKIIFGILIFILVGTGIALFLGYRYLNPTADYVVEHIKENPKNSSMTMFVNDQVQIMHNVNKNFPLASLKKLIIGAAFADQAMKNIIDTSQLVSLDDLDRFYFDKTDGGAHAEWLKNLKKTHGNDVKEVNLMDVARGMMHYSSNANATYLTGLLGLAQINNFMRSNNIEPHTPIFHSIIAALLINEIENVEDRTAYIAQLSDKEYMELSATLYEKFDSGILKKDDDLIIPSFQEQQVWSDRLERSTSLVYARFMNDLLHERIMNVESRAILNDLLDWPMEYKSNQEQFERLYAKGGSTLYILTEAIAVEDKLGNKIAFAIFFDELGPLSSTRIMKALPLFEKKLLSSESYRNQVLQQLK